MAWMDFFRQRVADSTRAPSPGMPPHQRPWQIRGLPLPSDYRDLAPNVACFATNRITAEGRPVGYMISDIDGWRFFAGDEDQSSLDDPDTTQTVSLNTIANHDPAVVPFLDEPVGSAWVRQGSTFVRE